MYRLIALLSLIASLSACNTIGGFGQDLSEAGKDLSGAALWSQEQIETLNMQPDSTNGQMRRNLAPQNSSSATANPTPLYPY